jgi:hypothetical protein
VSRKPSETFNNLEASSYPPVDVPITMAPCETLTVRITVGQHPDTSFTAVLRNGRSDLYPANSYYCVGTCSYDIPSAVGGVVAGTVGPYGRPTKVSVHSNWGGPYTVKFSVTIEYTRRQDYNIGGDTLSTAPAISQLPTTIYASMYPTESASREQYFKLRLTPGASVSASGSVWNTTNSSTQFQVFLADATGYGFCTLFSNTVPSGTTVFTGNTCAYNGSAPADLYIKFKTLLQPLNDIQLTIMGQGVTSSILTLQGAIGAEPLGPPGGISLPAVAYIPLGATARFVLMTSGGAAVNATFDLSHQAIEYAKPLVASAIFTGHVAFRYTTHATNELVVQTVHRGSFTVTITPNDQSLAVQTLWVMVDNPLSLGASSGGVDARIFDVAHQLGIPPDFIKGHVRQESRFNATAYRYEPIGPSGDLFYFSRGRNYRRATAPYAQYRLQTVADSLDPPLSAGSMLSQADGAAVTFASPPLRFGCDITGAGGSAVTANDAPLASDLYFCSDQTQNWGRSAGIYEFQRRFSLLSDPFTAQTPLAASYGYLQMTYETAIREIKWAGDQSGAQNPSLLFDTNENVARNGGTLLLGSTKVARDYRKFDPSRADAPDMAFADRATLKNAFKDAWRNYNPGKAGYFDQVANFVEDYPPVKARQLF